jgi:hypothetical protein
MLKKEIIFFLAIILVGFLDWLTTIAGVFFFGAKEANPLLMGATSNMMFFSAIKLSVVIITAFAFYKAAAISSLAKTDLHFTGKILNGGYSMTLLALTIVVANNIITIMRI